MITTRPAVASDAASVAAVVQRAYSMYLPRMNRAPAPMNDDYAALVDQDRIAVAVDEEQVVGVLVRWVIDGEMYVDNVAVDPAAHGRGIGNLLLQLAVDEGTSQGCRRVWLYTNAVMSENVGFYERRGFVQYDRRIDAGYDRIFFERVLTPDH